MKEIGGYMEMEMFHGEMLHSDGILLNCGRNALGLLLETRKIRKLWLPYFLCASVKNVCQQYNVTLQFYRINESFEPEKIKLHEDEWIYIVNYYGQISQQRICELAEQYQRLIIDNSQNYFADPIPHVDTLYTCRKYFGVSDGAILYTDALIERDLPLDESFERIHYVMGRYERTASEFYNESVQNNAFFAGEPIKHMSKLTYNILHAIDYEKVKKQRLKNASILDASLKRINQLQVRLTEGMFMYPFMLPKAIEMRKQLQKFNIYIPILWPEILKDVSENCLEWKYARHILPLPCDQRYGIEEMKYVIELIFQCIDEEKSFWRR